MVTPPPAPPSEWFLVGLALVAIALCGALYAGLLWLTRGMGWP